MPISHLESSRNSWSDNLKEVNLWKWNWWVCVSIIIWISIVIVIKRCLHSTFYLSSHFLLNSTVALCTTQLMTPNGQLSVFILPDPSAVSAHLNTDSFWIHFLYLAFGLDSLFFCLIGHFFSIFLMGLPFPSKSLSIRGLPNTHLFPSFTPHQQVLKA